MQPVLHTTTGVGASVLCTTCLGLAKAASCHVWVAAYDAGGVDVTDRSITVLLTMVVMVVLCLVVIVLAMVADPHHCELLWHGHDDREFRSAAPHGPTTSNPAQSCDQYLPAYCSGPRIVSMRECPHVPIHATRITCKGRSTSIVHA